MGPHNQPSHPALLDELAQQFAAHGFDVRYLMRAIVLSRPYQLSSVMSDPKQGDRRLFARVLPRGPDPRSIEGQPARSERRTDARRQDENYRFALLQENDFEAKFALTEDDAVRYETSIIQAPGADERPSHEPGRFGPAMGQSHLLSAVLANPFMSTQERIETLFLATVTRPPAQDELDRMTQYVASRSQDRSRENALDASWPKPLASGPGALAKDSAAMSDIYWALLNSSEFLLNH